MKKLALFIALTIGFMLNAQDLTMNITINDKTMTATLVKNSSTDALIERLQQGPVTYSAHDYGNFEKVGDLGFSLPQNNTQITTAPGDVILYQGRNLCLYYGQNSWNFTRIGKIKYGSEAELRDFLKAGGGEITVTISLPGSGMPSTGISSESDSKAYGIDGRPASSNSRGIIIKDGKKIYRR